MITTKIRALSALDILEKCLKSHMKDIDKSEGDITIEECVQMIRGYVLSK